MNVKPLTTIVSILLDQSDTTPSTKRLVSGTGNGRCMRWSQVPTRSGLARERRYAANSLGLEIGSGKSFELEGGTGIFGSVPGGMLESDVAI